MDQRGRTRKIPRLDVRLRLNQIRHDAFVTVIRRMDQRGPTLPILRLDVRLRLNQIRHDAFVTVIRRMDQRGFTWQNKAPKQIIIRK